MQELKGNELLKWVANIKSDKIRIAIKKSIELGGIHEKLNEAQRELSDMIDEMTPEEFHEYQKLDYFRATGEM